MNTNKMHDQPLVDYSETLQTIYLAGPEFRDDPRQFVERRAYELWQQRGGGDGDPVNDWLQAEIEVHSILSQLSTPAAPTSSSIGAGKKGSGTRQRVTHGR